MQTRPLPAATLATEALIVSFSLGAAVALALQLAQYPELTEFGRDNIMPKADRALLTGTTFGSGLLCSLSVAGYLWARRARDAFDRACRLTRRLCPLLVAPVLVFLLNWRTLQKHHLVLLSAILLVALLFERLVRVSLNAEFALPFRLRSRLASGLRRAPRWVPMALALALAVGFAVYVGYYTLLHHSRLQTQSFDLAIFDNLMWNLLRGEWFKAAPVLGRTGSHIQYHATFGAYLLAPLYALHQSAQTLLVIQAVLAAATIVPIYLLARRRLADDWLGLAMAFAYALYAPIHGPLFYDFHFLTTAPVFVCWTLYFFETGRIWGLVCTGIIALLWREDVSATLAAAALFYLLSGKRPLWALVGGGVATLYFGVVKFVVMPLHQAPGAGATFLWCFDELVPAGEHGFAAVLQTAALNPIFTLRHVLTEDKLVYTAQLLSPVVLMPLRHPRTWILLLPAAMFTLLSTGCAPLIDIGLQYTAHWAPFVFLGTIVVLGDWRARSETRPHALAGVCAVLLASVLVSYHFGAIFQHHTFRGGFRKVEFTVTPKDRAARADLDALVAMIPEDASVAATETEAPHVSNRADCFTLRVGFRNADYLLVNLDEVRQKGTSRDFLLKALRSDKYFVLEHRGRFVLWKRGAGPEGAEVGYRLLGVRGPSGTR